MSHDPRHEELSRLLDGELDAERATALRREIQEDPALARVWEAMQALPGELAALPEEAPPAALDEAVGAAGHQTAAVSAAPGPRPALERWLPWAVAASLAVVLLWPTPDIELVLAEGSQLVDGHVMVLAGEVPVEVDGRALITVEPTGRPLRVPGQEDDMIDTKTILAAVAGAAVTVVVYEGTALIRAGGDEAIEVAAGETETVGQRQASRSRPSLLAPRRVQASAADGDASREELVAEVDRLQGELDRLTMEATMARGQVGHYEGVPQAWPDDVPTAYRAAPFEKFVQDALAEQEDLELLEVDCGEFPCVALVQSHSGSPEWPRQFEGAIGDLSAAGFGDDPGISIWASNSRTDEGEVKLLGFTVVPPDSVDDDAQTRTNFRVENLMAAANEEALGEQPGEHDVDVN